MPDPREWISRIKGVEPPELWEEALGRASRSSQADDGASRSSRTHLKPTMPRRAALVAGVAVAIPLLVLIMLAIAIRTPGGNRATRTPAASSLSEIHELLERYLSDLWIAEARLAELQGELEVAHDEFIALQAELGPDPTDAQLLEIEALEERIHLWTQSATVSQAALSQLRERVGEARAVRAGLLPPPDDATYPLVATVTCDGDGTGGTHLSTPVVRMHPDGVDLHVVNRLSNEGVFLIIGQAEQVFDVPAGEVVDVKLPPSEPGDIEIVCTYSRPEDFGWPRPSHPLWVASTLPGGATVTPAPEPSPLDPLVLTASLDEEPVTWPEVAFVPAGSAEQEIGYSNCSDCVLPVPSALAVDRDGSFWIADGLKARIAHFARDGSFIEAFPAEIGSALPVSEHAADLAFVGDRLYVLLEEGSSKIAPVAPVGLGGPIFVNNEGQRLHVEALIPGQDQLLVLISGAEQLLGGYWAYATVDPATGQVTPSPGVLDSVESYIDIQPGLEAPPGTFEIRWFHEGRGMVAVQELRFQLVRGGEERRTSVGDMYVRTATHWGVATVVSVGDGQGTPVGKWYLEILPESPSITFERLPDEGFIGNVRRYLTVGPDGHVFWMRLLEDGLHIYRR
jgi:hypothetical protein